MFSRCISLGLIGLLAASCSSASTRDSTGEGATLLNTEPANQERIVSLAGDLTEFVYELGLGDSLVGIDVTTVAPPEALELDGVGIARFLAPEGVLAVSPTLVLADDQAEPESALDQIRGTGAEVIVFDSAVSFEEMYTKIEELADVLDAQSEGQVLIERVRSEISNVEPLENGPRIAYVYVRGPGTILLFGQGMTTQALIEGAGGIDVGVETGATGAVPLTPEALVAANPDVIIVPSEGLDELGGIDAFLALPGVAETKAGARRAILDYPQGDFLTLGPRVASSLGLLVDDLAALE